MSFTSTQPVAAKSRQRRRLHTAPKGAISAARDMGIQFRTDCGRWVWPARERKILAGDLERPTTCKTCANVVRARRPK